MASWAAPQTRGDVVERGFGGGDVNTHGRVTEPIDHPATRCARARQPRNAAPGARARFINQSGYDVTYKSDRAGLWAARIAISRLASSFNFFCAVSNNLPFALASTKPSHVGLPATRPFPHATSLPAVLFGSGPDGGLNRGSPDPRPDNPRFARSRAGQQVGRDIGYTGDLQRYALQASFRSAIS